MAASLHSWFGFGAVILLIFAIAIFVIYFFNVTTLLGLTKKNEELEEDDEDVRIADEHKNFAKELNDVDEGIKLFATVLEDEDTHNKVYQYSKSNTDIIKSQQEVMFGIDATSLDTYFDNEEFLTYMYISKF